MAKLYFKVVSDWEEVVRLRNEIARLKQELKGMDSTQSPATFKSLNTQLSASTQRMDELVTKAAQAGAVMEGNFKRKIFDASRSVNGFTEKIIAQKAVVKDVEADVKRLGEAYHTALKRNPLSASGKLEEYAAARKALNEEKAILFNLTQQQAKARLSVKKLRDEYALYKNDSKDIVEANNGIIISWKKALAIIGGMGVLKSLISDVTRVRMEIDSVSKSFETLLKSENKAKDMIGGLKELSIKSGLNTYGAAQTLLGFNVGAEKILPTLKSIGDITMGNNEKFSSMTLAFAQMSAAGRLMGQDLNQMINAGFNPLQIISEKTGKSIAILKKEMEQGAISSEMVADAFTAATSEGGRFYNMLEKQNTGTRGEKNKLNAVIKENLNEIGKANEGLIAGSYRVTTSLIQNYETIGKVLMGLIATYGTYRTAIMLVTAAESKHTLVEIGLTSARVLARKAQLALNATMLTNPYVLLATAVVGLGVAMWAFHDSATEAEKAQKRFNNEQEKFTKREEERKQKIEDLLRVIKDETETEYAKIKAYEELQKYSPALVSAYKQEELAVASLTDTNKKLNEERDKANYDNLIEQFSKYTKFVEIMRGAKDWSDLDSDAHESVRLEYGTGLIGDKLKQAEADLKKWTDALDEYKRHKEQLEEKNTPIDIKLKVAKADLTQIQEEFDVVKKKLEEEQAKLKESPWKIIPFSLQGEFNYLQDKLKSQQKKVSDLEKQKSGETNYKQDYNKAKKKWENAKKALAAIEKDKDKFTTKQYEDAKKRKESTEKTYKDLGGVVGNELIKQESEAEKQKKKQQKLSDDLLSLRHKNQQNEINLMKEGTEKKIAQINLDYQKEITEIKKLADKLATEQGGTLTVEQTVQISTAYSVAKKGKDKKTAKVYQEGLDELLKKYQDYDAKRREIEEKFTKDLQALEDKRTPSNSAQITGAQTELTYQRDKAFSEISAEFASRSDEFQLWMNNIASFSLEQLYETLRFAQAELGKLQIAGKGGQQLAKAQAKVDALKKEIQSKKGKQSESPDKKSIKEWQDLYVTLTKVDEQFEEIGNTVEGTAGEILSAAGNIASSTLQMINGIMLITETSSNAMSDTAKAASKSMQVVEKASVILSIIGAALQIVTKITSLFGSEGTEYYENLKQQLEAINEIYGKIVDKSKEQIVFGGGFAALDSFKTANQLLEKQIENYRKLAEAGGKAGASAGSHSYAVRANERLAGSWGDISKTINKNISSIQEMYKLTGEELYLIQSNLPEAWSKIPPEITDNLNAIIKCKDEASELKDALNEAITGVSYDSFYNGFIDQLSDMETSYEDMCDNFEDYLRKSMLAGLVAGQYKDQIRNLYNSWVAAGTDQNYDENEIEDLRSTRDKLLQSMLTERDKMAEVFGWDSSSASSQSATHRGIETITQDQAGELTGRITDVQGVTRDIKAQALQQTETLSILNLKADALLNTNSNIRNIADETRTILANSYLELRQISENTGAIVVPIREMNDKLEKIQRNTENL